MVSVGVILELYWNNGKNGDSRDYRDHIGLYWGAILGSWKTKWKLLRYDIGILSPSSCRAPNEATLGPFFKATIGGEVREGCCSWPS